MMQAAASGAIPSCIPPGIVAWWPADGDATDQINANNDHLISKSAIIPSGVALGHSSLKDMARRSEIILADFDGDLPPVTPQDASADRELQCARPIERARPIQG